MKIAHNRHEAADQAAGALSSPNEYNLDQLYTLGYTAYQDNPILGTWKQNIEKSVYNPGPAPPVGLGAVRQYAAGADGSIVAVTFNLDDKGLPSLGAISAANYDGKEYPQHTVATLAIIARSM